MREEFRGGSYLLLGGEKEELYGFAIFDSGNYALNILSLLSKNNFVFDLVAIPCSIAVSGCGYCIKFPLKHMDILVKMGKDKGMLVREIYEIEPLFQKNKYKKIYQNYNKVR